MPLTLDCAGPNLGWEVSLRWNVSLEDRFWSKVNKTDTCWIWIAAKIRGYGVIRINHKNHLAHRVSFEWAKGSIPKGMDIDHKCCNRSCVNPDHLRACTRSENIRNKLSTKNRTGYKGVIKNKSRWGAMINFYDRSRLWLGTFDTPGEAHKAYCKAAKKYFGDFANDGIKPI